MNQVSLIGRLTRDVEVRVTESGKRVATFTLAVNKNKEKTYFFRCNAWEETSNLMERFTRKGSKVAIIGELEYREWIDKNGDKRSVVEVLARRVELLDPKPTEAPQPNKTAIDPFESERKALYSEPNEVQGKIDDDLPF